METDSAYLELDTYSLAGTTNINATKTIFTFRNVDLRAVLGQMWDKYDKFSIRLRSMRYAAAATTPGGSQGYLVQQNIKGLDWINCYDEKWGSSQTYMPIVNINAANVAVGRLPTNSNYCWNFRKGQPIVDLEFFTTILILNTQTPTTSNVNMPDQNYEFTIQPAEDNQNEMGYFGLYTNQSNNPTTWPSKVITNNGRTYTYYGFNMRTVCREFWDKYEDFELLMGSYIVQGDTMTQLDALTPIQITGFDFMNNLTKQGSIYVTANAITGITYFGITGSIHISDVTQQYAPVQFKKSGDLVNLQMEWRNYDNSAINADSPSSNIRQAYFSFFVKPIKRGLNNQKGTLVLSSAGLTTTMTDLGITNAAYSDITLNNIDFRQACASFWDKYTKFNIFLTNMCSYITTVDTSEVSAQLSIEGLPTDPQVLATNPQKTTTTWNVGTITPAVNQAAPVGVSITYGNTKSTMFYKTNDKLTLRMYVTDLSNPAAAMTTQILRGTFIFTIVPVEE
jgi:hypothetical protein